MAEKVVLAYSGGLDTSVLVKWLQEKYGFDVIAVNIDVGNEKDFTTVRQKALDAGAIESVVIDAKEQRIQKETVGAAPVTAEVGVVDQQNYAASAEPVGHDRRRSLEPLSIWL